MKESVVDIHDLQEAAPFFKSRFGSFLGKVLIKWLSIDKVNKLMPITAICGERSSQQPC